MRVVGARSEGYQRRVAPASGGVGGGLGVVVQVPVFGCRAVCPLEGVTASPHTNLAIESN
jgi:hypothetical protein